MRAAGAACLLAGAYLFRAACLGERRRARRALSDLCRVLRALAEEVRLNRQPLPALLETLSEEAGADAALFLRTVSGGLRRGENLREVWHGAAARLPLSEADRGTVAALSSDLRGDEERLCRAALSAAERLAEHGAALDAAAPDAARRVTALSFSAAALAVILLY